MSRARVGGGRGIEERIGVVVVEEFRRGVWERNEEGRRVV